jgi:hypothetical protein
VIVVDIDALVRLKQGDDKGRKLLACPDLIRKLVDA